MRKFLLIFFILLISCASFASKATPSLSLNSDPDWHQAFIKVVYTNQQGETLPYRLYIPKNIDQDKDYPLVLYFHGYGNGKADNTYHLVHSYMSDLLSMPETQEKYPSFILVPLCLHPQPWAKFSFINPKRKYQKEDAFAQQEMTEPMRLTLELMDTLISQYHIDTNRLLVTGMSVGGLAVWDVIMRYPKKFAAAIPFCGWGEIKKAPLLKDMPIWNFHGTKDRKVPILASRRMIKALRKAGGKPRYTEINAGHAVELPVCTNPIREDVLKWMFEQRLGQDK